MDGGLTSALIIGGSTVVGASSSYGAASQNNEAIRRSAESTQAAATATAEQVTQAAQFEKRKIALQAAQVAGTIRAAGATSGQGTSGSFGALMRQNTITATENSGMVDINLKNQINAIRSGAQANIDQLSAGLVNPTLSFLTGGLQGIQTGLQITSALSSIGDLISTPTPVDNGPVTSAQKLTTGRDQL